MTNTKQKASRACDSEGLHTGIHEAGNRLATDFRNAMPWC